MYVNIIQQGSQLQYFQFGYGKMKTVVIIAEFHIVMNIFPSRHFRLYSIKKASCTAGVYARAFFGMLVNPKNNKNKRIALEYILRLFIFKDHNLHQWVSTSGR